MNLLTVNFISLLFLVVLVYKFFLIAIVFYSHITPF